MASKSAARLRFLLFLRIATCALVSALGLSASAATYYVAPAGSDSAAGTQTAPFASWARAQTAAAAGDTVYFRDGTYKYTAATTTCTSTSATIDDVDLNKSGTSGNPIKYFAYPGEHPVFDFSGVTDTSRFSCRQVGVYVEADWLYLKGLEFKGVLQLNMNNHESWCVYVRGGNNNVFEMLDAHHNMGPGFFVQRGGNNTFLNCDSHENEDKLTSNGDGQSADGFGCHPDQAGGSGNIFHGCRSWWNSDDSWDFIDSQDACTVEYSWAWYSGYEPDKVVGGAPSPLAAGNGNGFKGGGYGDPQTKVPNPTPQHIIRENASFFNKAAGLYANHEIVSPFFYNNTLYGNGVDANMLGLNGTQTTSVGILRNNLAYTGHALTSNMGNPGPISDEFNSWDTSLNLKITDADFQSVAFSPPASCPSPFVAGGEPCCKSTDMTCFAGMASARQADGSLPVVPFLRLSANSSVIGKGTNVGLKFSGTAPDLGCFDHGIDNVGFDGGMPASSGTSGGSTGNSGAGASTGSATTSTDDAGAMGAAGSSSGGSPDTSGSAVTGTDTSGTAASASGEATSGDGSSTKTSSGTSVQSQSGQSGASQMGETSGGKAPSSGCSFSATSSGDAGGRFAILALGLITFAVRRRSKAGTLTRTRSID